MSLASVPFGSARPLSSRDANANANANDLYRHDARALDPSRANPTTLHMLHPGGPTSPTPRAMAPTTPSRPSRPDIYSPSPSSAARARQPLSDAQRQLLAIQREFMRNAARMTRPTSIGSLSPGSPRLIPLGSPGPVTPLTLEEEDGADYLSATGRSTSATTAVTTPESDVLANYGQENVMEHLMKLEGRRQEERPVTSTSVTNI